MDQTTKQFIQKLTTNLNYAAQTAPTLQKHPKHLTQLLKNPQLLQALKNDPALFTTLLLKLPNGQPFKPLPYQTKFLLQLKSLKIHYTKKTNGKTIQTKQKITHPTNTHDDIAFALALALYAMRNRPNSILLPVH